MSEIEGEQKASVEETEVIKETGDSTESTAELVDSLPEPTKKTANPKILGGIAAVFALILGGSYFLGGSETVADEMRLESYKGTVTLQNSTETKEVVEGSRLVSEDNLETLTESSAYISLDKAKILKLDEESHMEVVKVEEHLDIELYKGSLYFSVTEPLTDAESLQFHTNNIVTGVRGTSGVVTYSEDFLQSEVVVLSGTVEVVTIEEEPEIVLVNQGEIVIATTQEDGSVTLEVKEQEKTPSYGFSANFLDDSGEDVEERTLPDWKEAYTEHLGEIESYYEGHPGLELRAYEENITGASDVTLYPVDLSATTYWLHDMDLDGTPELFLKFYNPSRGFITDQWGYASKVELTKIYCYALFGDKFESRSVESQDNIEGESLNGDYYLAVPLDGIGFYCQSESVYPQSPEYDHSYTSRHNTKGEQLIEATVYQEEGVSNRDRPLLDGTPIDSYTWSHYSDLSGLEWNG